MNFDDDHESIAPNHLIKDKLKVLNAEVVLTEYFLSLTYFFL